MSLPQDADEAPARSSPAFAGRQSDTRAVRRAAPRETLAPIVGPCLECALRAAAALKAFSTDGSSSTMAIQGRTSAMRIRLLRRRNRRVGHWANIAQLPLLTYFEIPAFSAMRTRSATVRTPSFSIIRLRWTLMVFSTVPKIAGNLLVEPAGDHMREHFALARRQGRNLRLDHGQFGLNLARSLASCCFGSRNRLQQVPFAHRLGQEINGAGLHGAHARRNVALPGDENDRPLGASGCQRLLQLEAVKTRHRDVEHRTARNRRIMMLEEFLR